MENKDNNDFQEEQNNPPDNINQEFVSNKMGGMVNEEMNKANKIASKIIKNRLKKERPEDAELIQQIDNDDIIIVTGEYDKVQDILHLAGIPFKMVNPPDLDRIRLNAEQILIVNCPGKFRDKGISNIQSFVKDGGYLFSTDWALLNLLEKAFPGYVKYNQKPTYDDVVEIEIVDKKNPFLDMIMSEDADPNWWLEGSSYPIQILNKDKVKVLLRSREMEKKYGEAPIAIYFGYGKGKVFHITSHFYLQRAETRTNRQKASSKAYFSDEMNMSEELYREVEEDMGDVNVSQIQSTYAMQQFMTNIIIDRKKSQKDK
jgi:hypothetical protein